MEREDRLEKVQLFAKPRDIDRVKELARITGMAEGLIRRKAFQAGLVWAERELAPAVAKTEATLQEPSTTP
jgi:hypothetical protein